MPCQRIGYTLRVLYPYKHFTTFTKPLYQSGMAESTDIHHTYTVCIVINATSQFLGGMIKRIYPQQKPWNHSKRYNELSDTHQISIQGEKAKCPN
jgi:hypothetical protein